MTSEPTLLRGDVTDALWLTLGDQLASGVRGQLSRRVWTPLTAQTRDQVRVLIREQLRRLETWQ